MIILLLIALLQQQCVGERVSENERVRLWHENGNVWPPNWQDDTPEYREAMAKREAEIMSIPGADERWENWMQFVQGYMLPRFTEQGFDVVRVPPSIHAKLKKAVDEGIAQWDNLREEQQVADSIYGPYNPKFVDLGPLAQEVIKEMRVLHEQWSGLQLRATSAYGVRLYRNGSSMVMHNDKPQTHVISSIMHIAHEYDDDSEPWPIEIEDHNGQLHAVALEEGQMLFYESAKCLHGRMTSLKGRYYGSIFIHYQPVDKTIWDYNIDKVIANVPPHWNENLTDDFGSRWAGQAITVDSRVVSGAPPRITGEGSRSPYRPGAVPADEERGEESFEEEGEPFDEYANSIYSEEEL